MIKVVVLLLSYHLNVLKEDACFLVFLRVFVFFCFSFFKFFCFLHDTEAGECTAF